MGSVRQRIDDPGLAAEVIFCTEKTAAHIYRHMAGYVPMSVHGCFLHSTIGEKGMVKSLCLLCGRCTGYSQSEELLGMAEKAHRCPKFENLDSPQFQVK